MNGADVDAFFAEIRTHRKFVAAISEDQIWGEHLEAIERVLQFLYMEGDDNPHAIEMFDAVRGIIGRKNFTLGKRLIMLSELLSDNQKTLEEWKQKRP